MQISEQERMIKDLEIAIERLHALYNQYFMGIERLEPTIPKKDVERKIDALRKIRFNNTALRFRFQTQVQKYSTHTTHWRRICRQIEEGTYQRDINRAKNRIQQKQKITDSKPPAEAIELNMDIDLNIDIDLDLFSGSNEGLSKQPQNFEKATQVASVMSPPPPPPRPGAALKPPPPPAPQPKAVINRSKVSVANNHSADNKLNEDRIKTIYKTYVAARKRTNENTENIDYKKIASLLKKTKEGSPDVKDFKVVIKNGKALIKTVK